MKIPALVALALLAPVFGAAAEVRIAVKADGLPASVEVVEAKP